MKIRLAIIITLFGGISLFVTYQAFVWNKFQQLSAQGNWVEEKYSKNIFMKSKSQKFKYVFVGSSRTQNNVNTWLFGQKGYQCFNLGLVGRPLADQVHSVLSACDTDASYIVLGISPLQLILPLEAPKKPTHREFLFFLKYFPRFFWDALSEQNIINLFPTYRLKAFVKHISPIAKRKSKRLLKHLKEKYNYEIPAGRIPHYCRGDKNRTVLVFKNGDGLVFSDRLKKSGTLQVILITKDFDPEKIALLRKLAKYVSSRGKKLIINIDPISAHKKYILDINKLRKMVPEAKIIDTQSKIDQQSLFADSGHLNLEGNKIYSEYLIKELEKIIK